jgi:lysozyme
LNYVNNLTPSQWLYDFLKGFEKFRPTGYKPTPKDVWTAGFGHTNGVTADTTCTMDEANAWLVSDVASAARLVNSHVTGVQLTQHEFDALVSLVFNIGSGNFLGSTMLRLLNAGDLAGAANEFPKWDKQAGAVLAGLLTRRQAEERYFDLP